VAKVARARSPIVWGSFEGLPASVKRANCCAGVRPPFVGSVVIVLRTDSKNRRRCAIVRYVSVRPGRVAIAGDYRERAHRETP
jgi:hypothetical protein